jgi:hypothetical protein
MERIRYRNTATPNLQESVKIYPLKDRSVKILLRTYSMEYEIVDAVSGVILDRGQSKSLHQIKIMAKRALNNLGVQFAFEQRERYEGPKT